MSVAASHSHLVRGARRRSHGGTRWRQTDGQADEWRHGRRASRFRSPCAVAVASMHLCGQVGTQPLNLAVLPTGIPADCSSQREGFEGVLSVRCNTCQQDEVGQTPGMQRCQDVGGPNLTASVKRRLLPIRNPPACGAARRAAGLRAAEEETSAVSAARARRDASGHLGDGGVPFGGRSAARSTWHRARRGPGPPRGPGPACAQFPRLALPERHPSPPR